MSFVGFGGGWGLVGFVWVMCFDCCRFGVFDLGILIWVLQLVRLGFWWVRWGWCNTGFVWFAGVLCCVLGVCWWVNDDVGLLLGLGLDVFY